ncbi:MAG: protein kinase [Planctomycetaceae bacterium]|nr:protein kinase [Planctomycetaceae bacterium]
MLQANETGCPPPDRLLAYSLGKLPEAVLDVIANHLETCPTCLDTLSAATDENDSLLSSLRTSVCEDSYLNEPGCQEALVRFETIGYVSSVRLTRIASRCVPEQLGRYRIISELGRGGMGTVYLAEDTPLGRQVALKIPHFHPKDNPPLLDRFYREARAAAAIEYPNLCPIYDVGQIGDTPYLAMAFIRGQSLFKLLEETRPFPQQEAARIVCKLALAADLAHGRGLIHRDIKPSNVMITREGEPILTDFGLARWLERADVKLTHSGVLVGTPAYMAPELLSGDSEAVGASCDIYSLGVVLYEMLTGIVPFRGSLLSVLSQLSKDEAERPSIHRPDVDAELEAICLKAMAKQPAHRYSSASQLADALEDYLNYDVETESLPVSHRRAPQERPLLWMIGGLILLGILLATPAGWRHMTGSQSGPPVTRARRLLVGTDDDPASVETSNAVLAYLRNSDLSEPIRQSMLTVVRQHPDETRWSGRSGATLFGIACKRLPSGETGRQAKSAILNLVHMCSVQELLTAKSLLDRYGQIGLTDATTLKQALQEVSAELHVAGNVSNLTHQVATRDGFAIAWVLAEEQFLTARLLEGTHLETVQTAYRDVMHRQARALMIRSNWQDALLLWYHLHQRKLVSQQLYLDAARCFVELDQGEDALRVLSEAFDTFAVSRSAEFPEQIGDMALDIQSEPAQALAERAYRQAIDRLRESVSQVQPAAEDGLPPLQPK